MNKKRKGGKGRNTKQQKVRRQIEAEWYLSIQRSEVVQEKTCVSQATKKPSKPTNYLAKAIRVG